MKRKLDWIIIPYIAFEHPESARPFFLADETY
jgi:hypothetical protein